MEMPYDSAISLLGIYLKRMKMHWMLTGCFGRARHPFRIGVLEGKVEEPCH